MSLDGGYIGSIDQAIANLHVGRHQGRQPGIEDGLEEGYQQGFEEGRDLRKLIEALKGTNQRLQKQVADLDAKYPEKSRQHTKQLWQYNRSLVFMNSVRRVLEALTREDTPQAARVRELFAEKYAQQVSQALEAGGIKAPPENESEFAKSLPQTRQFILNMLQSVGRKNELRTTAPEPEEDWVS